MWALPFSLETLEPTGEAFPIAENARSPSVSADGTLVYVDAGDAGEYQLVWWDRAGEKLGVIGRPQQGIVQPALSPDGRKVAVRGFENGNTDIWVHDVERPIKTRLTFDADVDAFPVWSPSGRQITYRSAKGSQDIFRRPAGGGEEELVVGGAGEGYPQDWSADGKHLLYELWSESGEGDLLYLRPKQQGEGFESVPYIQTEFTERSAKFSPDGKFVAYCSNESGREEVYVRPFPEGGDKWQVSTEGGCQPRWRLDGKELFYVESGTNSLMSVAVATTPSFSAETPKALFTFPLRGRAGYDIAADGERFVTVEDVASDNDKSRSIHVVENWYEEFRERQQD